MTSVGPVFQDISASSQPVADGSGKMLSYEVHFFRADGTLSLRLHTAAARHDDVLRALGKMQSGEFVEIKVWRGLDRVIVRNRPATAATPIEATEKADKALR